MRPFGDIIMSRKSLALIALLTLTISTVTFLLPDLASANYLPPPSIEIFSPISSPKVYSESSIQFYVRVNAQPGESSDITSISYCLDGKANVTLTNLTRENNLAYWTTEKGVMAKGNGFSINTTIDNVSEGKHTLTVYSHAADGKEMSKTIEFTVDYDYVPAQNPFGLPDDIPNGTATSPPITAQKPEDTQTETPIPTTNTSSILTSNPLPFIVIAVIAVSLSATVLFLGTKSHKMNSR